MRENRCENCHFWVTHNDHGGVEAFRTGQCQRFPPQSVVFPTTKPNDWCGEYRKAVASVVR